MRFLFGLKGMGDRLLIHVLLRVLLSPIAGIFETPCLRVRFGMVSPEMSQVFRFPQPLVLGGRLAGALALLSRTVMLTTVVSVVGGEGFTAMAALASFCF